MTSCRMFFSSFQLHLKIIRSSSSPILCSFQDKTDGHNLHYLVYLLS